MATTRASLRTKAAFVGAGVPACRRASAHFASNVAWLMGCIFPVGVSMSIHEPVDPHVSPRSNGTDRDLPSGHESLRGPRTGAARTWGPSPSPLRRRDGGAPRVRCATPGARGVRQSRDLPRACRRLPRSFQSRKARGQVRRRRAGGIHGCKTQDELLPIYAAADAFVFSSFAEGIPVVLMEAMARSLPCVAPWIAGIPN
jgi:glycosyltransferase involved in cell wall biosynthesis